MNEQELRRLFKRILASWVPLQVVIAAEACGGVTSVSSYGQGDPLGNGTGGQSPANDAGACANGACGSGGHEIGPCAFGRCYPGGAVGAGGTFGTGGGFLGRPLGTGGVITGTGGVIAGTGGAGAGGVVVGTGGAVTGTGGGDAGVEDPCAPTSSTFCPPPVCVPVPDAFKGLDASQPTPALCQASCSSASPGQFLSCRIVSSQGQDNLACYQLCEGRRPEGLGGEHFGGSELGAFFSQMAHLEAASVTAFRRLCRELSIHGAPRSLRRAARRAARDEIRHARIARALAERHGGRYTPPRIAGAAARSLEAVAIENVVEGCVRETYGALAATYHARHARDPLIRRAMRSIASDETRHAALSWRVFHWTYRRLSPESRRWVLAERDRAAAALLDELGQSPPPSVVATAGAPLSTTAREFAGALARATRSIRL